jgi:hypothetical protein
MNKMRIAALASALGLAVVTASASAWWGPFGGPGWGNGLFDGFGDMNFHMGGSARASGYGYGAPYYGYGLPYYGYGYGVPYHGYGFPYAAPYGYGPYAAYPYAAAPVAPQPQQQPAEK